QASLLWIQTAIDEVLQQRFADRAVLRCSLPQAQTVFVSVARHAQRHDDALSTSVYPIQEHDSDIHCRKFTLKQLLQFAAAGRNELPADAALPNAITLTQRLDRVLIVAHAQSERNLIHHRLIQTWTLLKPFILCKLHFSACLLAPNARFIDGNFSSCECNPSRLSSPKLSILSIARVTVRARELPHIIFDNLLNDLQPRSSCQLLNVPLRRSENFGDRKRQVHFHLPGNFLQLSIRFLANSFDTFLHERLSSKIVF